jgi:hypothetical protein
MEKEHPFPRRAGLLQARGHGPRPRVQPGPRECLHLGAARIQKREGGPPRLRHSPAPEALDQGEISNGADN